MKSISRIVTLLLLCFSAQLSLAETGKCPAFLDQDYKQLHSDKSINLCSMYQAEKPMVIVNTASHCGFTHQFGGLEALHEKYKDKGLIVVGFASNDFDQEAKDEAEAAKICFENFGVSFTMIAPTKVKGADANTTFSYLAKQSAQPSWNFNKYFVAADGKTIKHFPSDTKPMDSELEKLVAKALN